MFTSRLPWKLVLPIVAAAALFCAREEARAAEQKPLVVFLVRHAEKAEGGRDPELSEAGKQRAKQLANVLRDAKIQYIHSSNFVRTRDTAKPLVDRLKGRLRSYDPRKLSELATQLQATGGRHLVVGHSNTTPAMVKLLGGEPGTPILEASEYDRLYCLTIDSSGTTTTTLLRYGAAAKTKR